MSSKKQAGAAVESGLGRPTKDRPERMKVTEKDRLEHQRSIGRKVRSRREARGWSTVDLAKRTGLTPQNIRQLEAGEQAPRTWTLYLIALALDCSAGWLAYGG